ncbi:MAG TPA: glycosyltransferase family 39 protein [bacterium]|nr:glycosyltransferase family 39 protein [bacterium]
MGAIFIGLGLLQTDRFNWLGPSRVLPGPFWPFLLLLGAGLAWRGFRGLSLDEIRGDLSRSLAYPVLFSILTLAGFLRFVRADQAYLAYWNDPANFVGFADYIAEFHRWMIIYPGGATEPLFPDVAGLIWWLFPGLKALFVMRLAANLISLTALWVFYRLGREVTGKRYGGLIMAGLGAVSKPLLLHDLSAQNAQTLILSVSLYLWFQVRVLKKPDLRHFLQWGTVLAFGLYTYNAIRPWYFFLMVATLAWILWTVYRSPGRPSRPVRWKPVPHLEWSDLWLRKGPAWLPEAFLVFFVAFYFLFYLDHVLSLFHDNLPSRIWGGSMGGWVLWQALLGPVFLQAARSFPGLRGRLYAWAAGALVAGILSHPLALHTEAAARIANNSLLPKDAGGWLSIGFYSGTFQRLLNAVRGLFLGMSDRADMNVVGDPVLDFHAAVLVLLGLVWVLSRPGWLKVFFVLTVPVSVVPFLFTNDPHGAKLLGAVMPLLLVASWALTGWLGTYWAKPRRPVLGALILLVFLGFWGWEARATYVRVFDKWWSDVVNDDLRVGTEVDKLLPAARVYLVPAPESPYRFFDAAAQAVLHDGHPTYLFQEHNLIPIRSGEVRPDVGVVLSGFSKKTIERLRRDFPRSEWTPGWQYYQKSRKETPFLYRVRIKASDIPERPGKAFQFLPVHDTDWVRSVYKDRLGMRQGVVFFQDVAPGLNPPPAGAKDWPVSGEGFWTAPADGEYTLSVNCPEWVKIWMDGRVALESMHQGDARPVSHRVFLKAGEHRVRYSTYLMVLPGFAAVTIENHDLGYQKVLGTP